MHSDVTSTFIVSLQPMQGLNGLLQLQVSTPSCSHTNGGNDHTAAKHILSNAQLANNPNLLLYSQHCFATNLLL
jgi:hypothetical protein